MRRGYRRQRGRGPNRLRDTARSRTATAPGRGSPAVPSLPGARHVRGDGEAPGLRPAEDARYTPVAASPAGRRYTRGVARSGDAMRHATCCLCVLAVSAAAGATDAPGVLLTRKTLDDQAHTTRVDVAVAAENVTRDFARCVLATANS